LALHARPRATKDLDVFVAPTRANARRILRALSEFFGGSPPSYISEESLLDPTTILQLGVAPVRVNILSHFATRSFGEAWADRVDSPFGETPAHFISRAHLIAEKQHFDRPQDRADLAMLRATSPGDHAKPAKVKKRAKAKKRQSQTHN
jgi:hypothetical protein